MRARMRYIIIGLLVMLIPAVLSVPGCAGSGQSDGAAQLQGDAPQAGAAPQIEAALPPLSDYGAVPREASAETQQTQNGDEAVSQSPGAVANGSVLELVTSEAEPLQWGVFVFALGGNSPLRFTIDAGVNSGQFWLAVGNYAQGSWEVSGPYDMTGVEAQTLPSADYTSPGGNASVAVIAARMDATDADIDLNAVTLTADDGGSATFTVSGKVSKPGADVPVAGVTVTLDPGGRMQLTDDAGAFSFGGVEPGSYTLAPVLADYTFTPESANVEVTDADVPDQNFEGIAAQSLYGVVREGGVTPISGVQVNLVALNPDGSINAGAYQVVTTDETGFYEFNALAVGDYRLIPQKDTYKFSPNIAEFTFTATAPQGITGLPVTLPDTVTYDNDMLPLVFEPVCMNCHDSAKTGVERNFAPLTVNWDTYDGTTELLKTHGNNRVQADTMPPATLHFKTTQFQKDLFQKWLDGGFLEN